MSATECQAVIILFDNSMSAIDGDFTPTRLDAQKAAVQALADSFSHGNRESMVGFGTLSGACGVHTSLTKDMRKFRQNLDNIQRDGTIHLEQAIKCGLFALRHRPREISLRHLIVMLGSKHDLTKEAAPELASLVQRDGVILDLVVLGDDGIDMDPLNDFMNALGSQSRYVTIPKGRSYLADIVQDKLIHIGADVGDVNPEDAELRQAIQQSSVDDEELQRAILLSLAENNPLAETPEPAPAPPAPAAPAQPPSPSIDEMDEELLAAMKLSMEEVNAGAAPAPEPAPAQEKCDEATKKEIEDFLADPDALKDLEKELGLDDDKKDGEQKK